MSAHTPGPWHVAPESKLCIDAPDGNVAIVNLARASEADARLIAAAPDLLAALRELVAAEDVTIEQFTAAEIDRLEAAMKQAQAAIAHAEAP